ncbi:hypothetical protein Tco_0753163 [Tanacetum coccineum]
MFLNMDQLEKQLDNKEFQKIGSMASFKVLETQFQMFINSQIYLNDNNYIRPIYNEEPMAEVQTTAEINVFAIGQQHTEQPELNNEGETYKDLFDSIKRTRVQTKDQNDSLMAQLNKKSNENADVLAQIQKKGFAIAALKNELRKLTGNRGDNQRVEFSRLFVLDGFQQERHSPLAQQRLKVNPPNGSNAYITNQGESKQALNVIAGTLLSTAVQASVFNDQMTSDHNRSELGIHDHSNEPSSSKLVPKVVPLAVKTATSRQLKVKSTIPPSYSICRAQQGSYTNECDEVKVNVDFDEIETKNIELEYRVASLIKENEHLKLTYQSLFDSFKKSRGFTSRKNSFSISQKIFDDVNLELSNRTAKFEAYFEKLEKTKAVLERQLACKVDDSKAEKDRFLKEINHLRTQLENLKGKRVETKFDNSSILGKPPLLNNESNPAFETKLHL